MKKLHNDFILEYLIRYTDDLEVQLQQIRRNLNLKTVDAVDIIDFIETRAAYQTAVKMAGDISKILSWKL